MGKPQWPSGLGLPNPDRPLNAHEFELLRSSQLLTSNTLLPGSVQLWETMAGLPSVLATAEKIVSAKGAPVKVGANRGAGHNDEDTTESRIIHIDRSTPFDASIISAGWKISEQDERSLALTELDLSKIKLESTLKADETLIKGEERLLRLKAMKVVRLDARVLQTLHKDPSRIPEGWKGHFIYFDGTILRRSGGRRYVLYLCFLDDHWYCRSHWLKDDWDAERLSAVLDVV